MPLFYKRRETEKEIIIEYKYMYIIYLLIVIFLVASFIFPNYTVLSSIFWIIILIYLFDIWKPMCEIRKAMKKGYVKFSGSKWSASNPIVAVIDKNSSGKEKSEDM